MTYSRVNSNEMAESKEHALHYMKALVAVARESFLILDSDLRVIFANQVFYDNFKVSAKQTENQLVYKLGNGQWNIPALKGLLEKILPEKKVVRDYEVTHVFETIGKKTIMLNARQIDTVQLIILAMEDITERENLKNKLAKHTKDLETLVVDRTAELANRVAKLELMNKSMVGRELKMVELKKEIATLKGKSSSNTKRENL